MQAPEFQKIHLKIMPLMKKHVLDVSQNMHGAMEFPCNNSEALSCQICSMLDADTRRL